MLRRLPLLLLLCGLGISLSAQQDTVPSRGRGDGSGGGRGDGSGGGAVRQVAEQRVDTVVSKAIRPKASTPATPRPGRPRFAGISLSSWENSDEPLPTEGTPVPRTLLDSYARASSAGERARAAALIVDTVLIQGTLEAQFAWSDSLRRLAMIVQDTALLMKAYYASGTALVRDGRNGRAFDDLRAALALCEEERAPAMAAMIHARIGDGLMRMGGSTGALQRYAEVLRIARTGQVPPRTIAHVLRTIAHIQLDVEQLDSAAYYYERAAGVAEAAGLATIHARSLIGSGDVAVLRGDLRTATQRYEDAMDLAQERGDAATLLDAQLALGGALLADGRPAEARRELRMATSRADSLQVPMAAASARLLLADAMGNDHDAAFTLLREAGMIAQEHGLGAARKEVMLSLAECYAHMGRLDEAYDLAMDAVQLTDSLNTAFWEEGTRRQLQRSQVGLKDKDIADLERQREEQDMQAGLQQERIARQRNLIIGAAVIGALVLALAAMAYRAYRSKRRTASALALAHAEVLRQKQRAEESERTKDRFLANVSHEIRTPLNAIMGFTGLLLEEQHDERTKRFLSNIHDAGDNLLVVINDVLDLSRMEAGRLTLVQEPFDLERCVSLCCEILQHRAEEQRDHLTVAFGSSTPAWVIGDSARLSQILINLLGNALKFTTDGEVRLEVSPMSTGLRFHVSDTGVGIPADKLAQVFERFTQVDVNDQRRYGGTGLGLAIVQELVTLHKGTIAVESTPGRGTLFTLDLPLEAATPPSQALEPVRTMNSGSLAGRTILVAEDNDLNAQVTTETLRRHYPGSVVVRVTNGRDTVKHIVEDDEEDTALVLMDVQMPDMDGMAATRAIRALKGSRGRVPIIALTASILPHDLSACIDAGMDACVSKPFKVQDLLRAIGEHTGDAGASLAQEGAATDPYADLFLALVPPRLQALREAHGRQDHDEVLRIVHTLRPQLVQHDAMDFAEACDRVLALQGDASHDERDAHVIDLLVRIEHAIT